MAASVVPEKGLEPLQPFGHTPLKRARLPIPPLRWEMVFPAQGPQIYTLSTIPTHGTCRKHEAPIHRVVDRGDVTLQIDL